MKICLVGPAYPLRGGIAHFNAHLFFTLQEMGHQVRIISFKRQYPDFLFPGKTQQDASETPLEVPAEALIDSINPVTWWQTAAKIRDWQPDLVVFQYWMPFFAPAFGTIAWRLRRTTKTVFMCHNIVPHEKIPLVDSLLTWWGLKWIDFFVLQSASVRADLLRLKPKAKWQEVPHPVYRLLGKRIYRNDARQQLGLNPEEPVLLFFGYIREYKGLRYLLDALALVRKKIPVRLLVAGECYGDPNVYRQQVSELGLTDAVELNFEYISNEAVGSYFTAADAVVLPYTSATQSGIVQMAYNFDKPVIVTAVGGLPDVVDPDRTGLVVAAKDSESLAQGILRFFELQTTIGFEENVRSFKTRFSWERLAQTITGFLNE